MKKNKIDRLCLAWNRLNKGEWDSLLGEKPKDYDEDYFRAIDRAIAEIVGEANISRCWWIYELGKTEEEWFLWYTVGREAERRELMASG